MRILLLTQLFHPEPNLIKGLTFARELVQRGHSVEVLTCFPNYPGGKIYPEFRQRLFQREVLDGITIYRLPLLPSHDASGLRRMLCYLSYAFSALCIGIWLIARADVVHVYQGPASLALPAMIFKFFRGMPYVYDIQDIWPDSVTSSGMLSSRLLLKLINGWCNLAYRQASRIVVLSEGFKRLLIERGVPDEKIAVVYNWCDEGDLLHAQCDPTSRQALGFAAHFIVMYAGTMGRVQGLAAVVRAGRQLRDVAPNIRLVLIGGGVEVEYLQTLAHEIEATNVQFLPRQPSHLITSYLQVADTLLIHLKDEPLFRITIPQKTQAYLAAGKPIIIATEGEAADLIIQANAGISCVPEDVDQIAKAILFMYNLPEANRRAMGEHGRQYYLRHLSMHIGIDRLETIFTEVTTRHRRNMHLKVPPESHLQ